MRLMQSNKGMNLIVRIILFIMAIIFMVPVVLTVLTSVQMGGKLTLQGYQQLFLNCFPFYRLFWNSIIYTVIITVGTLLICIPAAFGFKYARFPGKQYLFLTYIIIMMMPLQVMVLPNYIGLRDIGLINTPMAILLPMVFAPLGVVVTHQYMREIDDSVLDAARLETNSVLRIILKCIVPQIKVCVAAVALFVYAETWSMVEQPMLYLNDDKLRTLSTFVVNSDQYVASVMSPASVIFMIPVFLCYLLFHEELKQGLKL